MIEKNYLSKIEKDPSREAGSSQIFKIESLEGQNELGVLKNYEEYLDILKREKPWQRPTQEKITSEKAGFFKEGNRIIYWQILSNGEKIVVKETDVASYSFYSVSKEIQINRRIADILKRELDITAEEPIGYFIDSQNKKHYLMVKFIDCKSLHTKSSKTKKLHELKSVVREVGVIPSDLRIDDLAEDAQGNLYLLDLDTWDFYNSENLNP